MLARFTEPRAWLSLVALAAVLLSGCGSTDPSRPALARVTGVVTYSGNPVSKGSIIFTPAQGTGGGTGQVAVGQLEEDGAFTLTTFDTGDGAILGQHIVTIEARGDEINELNQMRPDGSIPYILPKPTVPVKYTNPATSPLRQTVEDKRNHFTIQLED